MTRGPLRPWRSAVGAARVLLVLLVVLLAACGSGEVDTAAPPSSSGPAAPSPARAGAAASEAPAVSSPSPVASSSPGASPSPGGAGDAVAVDRAVVERLRAGGLVVYVRHAATEPVTEDPATLDLDDPSTQRNLSEEGRAQSAAIGEALRALDIPVGDVLVSPYWRAQETARLAFPDADLQVRDDLLFTEHPDADVPALVAAARRYLATAPPAGENTVVVAHAGNLEGAARVRIEEGAAAVVAPGDPPAVLAVVPADAWPPDDR